MRNLGYDPTLTMTILQNVTSRSTQLFYFLTGYIWQGDTRRDGGGDTDCLPDTPWLKGCLFLADSIAIASACVNHDIFEEPVAVIHKAKHAAVRCDGLAAPCRTRVVGELTGIDPRIWSG